MRKIVMTLILLSAAAPAFALGPVDAMTCKQVKLKAANNRTVLVRRLTGEVLYAKQYDGSWVEVTAEQKRKYQNLYNDQVHPEK